MYNQLFAFFDKILSKHQCGITKKKQGTKIGNNYSSWRDFLSGVPQVSVLGPLLFNICICDMFLLLKKMQVANYTDDTTSYIYDKNIESMINFSEQSANLLFNWFKDNQLKGNENKCHVLLSTDETVQVNKYTDRISNRKCEKILGVKIDCKLSFDYDIENIFEKTGAKLNALTRQAPYMNIEKKHLPTNAFFRHSLIIVPLHNRLLNHNINRLRDRCLRVIYDGSYSFYD